MGLCAEILHVCGRERRRWRAPVCVLVHTWPWPWSQAGTFFCPDQLSGSLLLLLLQGDFKVLFLLPFFFPFGPYSSPTTARADRIGMAVGGWGRWGWREEWQPSVSGQSLNHRTALAYENDMGEFSLCLFGRKHAINPTQARGCLWGIIIREQIFDFSISTDLERLWTCCAQVTFLRLFPRQM